LGEEGRERSSMKEEELFFIEPLLVSDEVVVAIK
jgi:hypothetical protein